MRQLYMTAVSLYWCFRSRTVYYHCFDNSRIREREWNERETLKTLLRSTRDITYLSLNCRCQITYQSMLKYLVISVSLSICYKFLLHTNFCLLRFVNLAVRRAICYAKALLSNSKEHGDQPRIIIIRFVNNLIIIFTISIVHGAHSKALHIHPHTKSNVQTHKQLEWHGARQPTSGHVIEVHYHFFTLFCIAFCSNHNCFSIQKFKYCTNGVSAYRLMSVDELTMCVYVFCFVFSNYAFKPLNSLSLNQTKEKNYNKCIPLW